MDYIKRDIETTIVEAAKYFPVITVTGPRQSGKTTMLRHVFPDLHYYSLEDLDTRSFAMKDPVRFLHLHDEGMILDEVHLYTGYRGYGTGNFPQMAVEPPEGRYEKHVGHNPCHRVAVAYARPCQGRNEPEANATSCYHLHHAA